MTATRARNGVAGIVGATVLSGGGSVMLFDMVMGQLLDQQAAHIQTLERALVDCARVSDRCDSRLETCQDRLRDARGAGGQ